MLCEKDSRLVWWRWAVVAKKGGIRIRIFTLLVRKKIPKENNLKQKTTYSCTQKMDLKWALTKKVILLENKMHSDIQKIISKCETLKFFHVASFYKIRNHLKPAFRFRSVSRNCINYIKKKCFCLFRKFNQLHFYEEKERLNGGTLWVDSKSRFKFPTLIHLFTTNLRW